MLERLNDKYTDHIKFYLSKSDTAGSETDRQVCNTLLCMYMLNMCKWYVSECNGFVYMDIQGPHTSKCYHSKPVHKHSYTRICI